MRSACEGAEAEHVAESGLTATVTVAVQERLPLKLVAVMPYVVLVLGVTEVEPLRFVGPEVGKFGIAVAPLEPALARETASVEVHVRVEESPTSRVMLVGFAASVQVGNSQREAAADFGVENPGETPPAPTAST